MKLIATIFATLMACSIMAQGFKENTLDVNYNAMYRDTLSLRASTRLSDRNNWNLRGFNAGAGFRLMPGFSITYDLSRGNAPTASLISRYGFGYQYSKPNFNINISAYSFNGTPREDGIHGRIDLSIKFK